MILRVSARRSAMAGSSGGAGLLSATTIVFSMLAHHLSADSRLESSTNASEYSAESSGQKAAAGQSTLAT
jgi:hypothetical protein